MPLAAGRRPTRRVFWEGQGRYEIDRENKHVWVKDIKVQTSTERKRTFWSDGQCGLCSTRPPSVPSPTCWFSCTQAVGLVSVHNYLFTHCPSPPRIIGSTPPSFRSWEAPGWRKVGPPSCFKKLNTTWPRETISYLSPCSWSWQKIFLWGEQQTF